MIARRDAKGKYLCCAVNDTQSIWQDGIRTIALTAVLRNPAAGAIVPLLLFIADLIKRKQFFNVSQTGSCYSTDTSGGRGENSMTFGSILAFLIGMTGICSVMYAITKI